MQQSDLGAAGTSVVAGQAKDLARASTQQVRDIGQTTKERLLREVDSRRKDVASEIEKLATTLEGQRSQSEVAGPLLDVAASSMRKLSSTLKDHSAEQLLQSASRNPATILAGTFALGFLTARLFRA